MLKFMRLAVRHFDKIIQIVTDDDKFWHNRLMEVVAKNCSYDKRKRGNYNQEFIETIGIINPFSTLT